MFSLWEPLAPGLSVDIKQRCVITFMTSCAFLKAMTEADGIIIRYDRHT